MKIPGDETIAAIATPLGEGGIGIIRISGPEAVGVGDRIFRGRQGRALAASPSHRLFLGIVVDPGSETPIDEVLAVRMPESRSYTGEPTVEFHTHGGRAIVAAVLEAALSAGARQAEPGEFTKRAFLSGRLDLSQAEAVAELIGAESEGARRLALGQLQGVVGAEIRVLRERLLDLIARAEAALDFGEEEGVESDLSGKEISALADDLRSLAARGRCAAGIRDGTKVVIAGRPNAGKSSIFNYLLNRQRSIVTSFPGTTRDYIKERTVIEGAVVSLIDTAGLSESENPAEAEGVRRSLEQLGEADIVVLVIDGSQPFHPEDSLLIDKLRNRSLILVISKSDLESRVGKNLFTSIFKMLPTFVLSVMDGTGFPEFIREISTRCSALTGTLDYRFATPNNRHQEALRRAAVCLDAANGFMLGRGLFFDQAIYELRESLAVLGEITGENVDEEILDRIFSRFCIGK